MTDKGDFYRGEVAREYETRRASSTVWEAENHILRRFLQVVVSEHGTRVLDVPVGTGRFLPLYQKLRVSSIGVDISAEMLDQARTRADSTSQMVIADVERLPLQPGYVDVAVCIRLAHLIGRSKLKAALREIALSLRPNGWLILGVRLHALSDSPPKASWLAGLGARYRRILGFHFGRLQSRPHSERGTKRALAGAGFSVSDRTEVTRYGDGSRYEILLLKSSSGNGTGDRGYTVELFGLPGVGKSSVSRAVLAARDSGLEDGYAALQGLSAWQCVRRRPVAASRLLLRLVPAAFELRTLPAKKIVVNALRQLASAKRGASVLYQEGTAHEVWRQLMTGEVISDRLISRLLPVADRMVLLEAPDPLLLERLASKRSPGPINRVLLSQPLHSPTWIQAHRAYDRIKRILMAKDPSTVILNNLGDLATATNDLRATVEPAPRHRGKGRWSAP